jgi:hypothetical protein
MAKFIPSFILQPLATVLTYISVGLGIGIPALGVRTEQFGHSVLTNVGSLGYQQGFAPLCPPMRGMGLFCIGAIQKKAVVVNDEIVIQSMMNVTQTGDHRFGDASIFLPLSRCFNGYINDPENFKSADWKENAHWSEKKRD